ncbi:UNVERIFIED_CONTAM: hypothetical protein NCL1_35348 [Trichonephila clavipes]
MYEILTTARDLELEVNGDGIEELIMGHEDELTTELQEIILAVTLHYRNPLKIVSAAAGSIAFIFASIQRYT